MNFTFHTFLLALPFLVHLASCTSGGQKTYYPDGTLKSVQTPNFHETYHENGKVKERISVNSAGQRNGDTIEYLSDGRAWSSRPYRNGEEDGTEYRLYPTRTPVCSWRDGIVRSVYQDGGWQTRELTPAEQASIERKEDAERLRMEMAMRQSEREAQSRQNTLAALQGLAAGLQSLNNSTSSYSGSGGLGLMPPGPQYSSTPTRQASQVSQPSSATSGASRKSTPRSNGFSTADDYVEITKKCYLCGGDGLENSGSRFVEAKGPSTKLKPESEWKNTHKCRQCAGKGTYVERQRKPSPGGSQGSPSNAR